MHMLIAVTGRFHRGSKKAIFKRQITFNSLPLRIFNITSIMCFHAVISSKRSCLEKSLYAKEVTTITFGVETN